MFPLSGGALVGRGQTATDFTAFNGRLFLELHLSMNRLPVCEHGFVNMPETGSDGKADQEPVVDSSQTPCARAQEPFAFRNRRFRLLVEEIGFAANRARMWRGGMDQCAINFGRG